MASTLLSTNVYASNPSSHIKMPQVFVVPPEEDDTPAWCCFDANVPPSSASTSVSRTDSPHHVLSVLREEPDVPFLHCNIREPRSIPDAIPMPKRNGETRSIMDVLMSDDYMELGDGDEMGLDMEEIEQELDLETNVGNDSEVVEVVKVGRYTADVEEHFRTSTPPALASKSLRARASGVLRSLRNAGKGPMHSKSKAQIILPPADEEARTETSTRRSSVAFSQLVSPLTTLQSSSSVSSFDLVEVSSIPPLKGPRYPSSLRNVSLPSVPSAPFASSNTACVNFGSPLSSSSPQTTSNRRHFSMMTLNRIFSFSRSDEISDSIPVSRFRNSSGPSTESSSEPETPTEDSAPRTPGHIRPPDQKRPPGESTVEEGDISFEMRLDSLHFDSLSFDVDKF